MFTKIDALENKPVKSLARSEEAEYVRQMVRDLYQRSDAVFDLPATLNLAAVRFFRADENPAYRNEAAEAEKRELWLACPDIPGFFLATPLKKLTPFWTLSDADFRQMMTGALVEAKLAALNFTTSPAAAMLPDGTMRFLERLAAIRPLT